MGMSSASCAISRLDFIRPLSAGEWLVADSGGGELGHELVLVEALEPERLDELGLSPGRDERGERLADERGGLEAVRPPAGADVEVLDLGLAEDRAVVGAQVAEA